MKLERYLKRRKLNASQLADELKISRQMISHRIAQGYEVGKVNGKFAMYNPTKVTFVKAPPELEKKVKIKPKRKQPKRKQPKQEK